MSVSVVSSPTGLNRINQCAVWELNITGTIDETRDERGLYRLMSEDGQVTDWVALPPVGQITINFSKEISGALETPVPSFAAVMDASSMKKKFWLEYGDIVYDKEACTKTENLGSTSAQSEFINAVITGPQQPNFSKFTMRPDYIKVPRNNHYDFLFTTDESITFRMKLCNGQILTTPIGGRGDITCFGVGIDNSIAYIYRDQLDYYEVITSTDTYRFGVIDGEIRAVNDYKMTASHNRMSLIMFLEPSGGYSCVPVEYLTNTSQSMSFEEICIYNGGCGPRDGSVIYNKTTRATYNFSIRSPRTQQFGIWMQHFAAAKKYFVLHKDEYGQKHWVPFIVNSVGQGYAHEADEVTVSGYLADGLNTQ